MSNIESQVMASFLSRLAEHEDVSETVLDGLRVELLAEQLPSADKLVELFTSGSGEPLA
jgi:hypothetical protein